MATLAGAFLAWALARLTSKRAERREDGQTLRRQKLEAYSEFWATSLAFTRAEFAKDITEKNNLLFRASEAMLPIELFGTREVISAAQDVLRHMSGVGEDGSRTDAMRKFREQVAAEMRVDL